MFLFTYIMALSSAKLYCCLTNTVTHFIDRPSLRRLASDVQVFASYVIFVVGVGGV